jgi:hypothetical protein
MLGVGLVGLFQEELDPYKQAIGMVKLANGIDHIIQAPKTITEEQPVPQTLFGFTIAELEKQIEEERAAEAAEQAEKDQLAQDLEDVRKAILQAQFEEWIAHDAQSADSDEDASPTNEKVSPNNNLASDSVLTTDFDQPPNKPNTSTNTTRSFHDRFDAMHSDPGMAEKYKDFVDREAAHSPAAMKRIKTRYPFRPHNYEELLPIILERGLITAIDGQPSEWGHSLLDPMNTTQEPFGLDPDSNAAAIFDLFDQTKPPLVHSPGSCSGALQCA